MRYGIIGNGRASRHLAAYLNQSNIPFLQWSRGGSIESWTKIISDSDILFILISDQAIEPFISEHFEELKSKKLIHFSGALSTKLAYGMHPLMCFTESLYELSVYQNMVFVCEKGSPKFTDIFPTLTNPTFEIGSEQKALYHALCVMAGNFTTLLWQNLFSQFENELNLPHEIAIPYLKQVTRNLIDAPHAALTGPLFRNDQETMGKNIKSLEGSPYQNIYLAFIEAYRRKQNECA